MKSRITTILTFLLCCFFILDSCASMPTSTSENVKKATTDTPINIQNPASTPVSTSQECKVSEHTFDYQLGEVPPDFDWSGALDAILPPQEWKDVAHFSQPSSLLILQERKEKTILWIYGNDGNLLRYSLSNSSSDNIEILPGPISQRMPALHVDFDNNVWGSRGGHCLKEIQIHSHCSADIMRKLINGKKSILTYLIKTTVRFQTLNLTNKGMFGFLWLAGKKMGYTALTRPHKK